MTTHNQLHRKIFSLAAGTTLCFLTMGSAGLARTVQDETAVARVHVEIAERAAQEAKVQSDLAVAATALAVAQEAVSKDELARIIRESRNLMENDEWQKAVEALSKAVTENAKSGSLDAALYWLALSQKKIDKLQDAAATIEKLTQQFPQSNWANDARALQVEIASRLGRAGIVTEAAATSQEDTVKIVALQSLFQSNPERAVALSADIVKTGSSASRPVRENCVTFLGQYGGKQALPLLTDRARNETDPKIKRLAIFWLGNNGDATTLEFLRDLALKSGNDLDVGKAAIKGIAQIGRNRSEWAWNGPGEPMVVSAGGPSRDAQAKALVQQANTALFEIVRSSLPVELRRIAVSYAAARVNENGFDDLAKVFAAETNTDIRKEILYAFARMKSPAAQQRLFEAARSESTPELRRAAIVYISQLQNDQCADFLCKLYDEEKSPELRERIITSLGMTKQKLSTQKLIAIMKNDPSIELRKKAIFWLGQSKDPEAIKAIEDLLK